MLNREPSRRLQEISRLISRQAGHEKEGVVLSCNLISCSLLFLLILPPVTCLVLVIVGICALFLCPTAWLPIWLVLLGLLLPSIVGLLSYSPNPFQPRIAFCLVKAVLCVSRQHCRLTIFRELVELTNSETAAATPSGRGARSWRSLSSLETGSD